MLSPKTIVIFMPRLGESIVEATLVRWRVHPGEVVMRGQILAEVETDKATSEIPAPDNGMVVEILTPEGARVPVDTPILSFISDRTVPIQSSSASIPHHLAPRGPRRSSPVVRRIAREYGLDLSRMEGSGRSGRITRADALAAANQPTPHPIQSVPMPARDQVRPFSRRRAQIAEHMTLSLATSAHVAAIAEIDVSQLMAARKIDATQEQARGVQLTVMPYVIMQVAQALTDFPEMNATVRDQTLILRAERNIGVAVDTEDGVVVPVIHGADRLSLVEVARRLSAAAKRARAAKLTTEDVQGGTFTISNPGREGNLFGISIIRQPEVAILRLGSIVKRAVVRTWEGEDAIVIRPMMYAALSYDHRVIDGRTGNAFLTRIATLIARTSPQLIATSETTSPR